MDLTASWESLQLTLIRAVDFAPSTTNSLEFQHSQPLLKWQLIETDELENDTGYSTYIFGIADQSPMTWLTTDHDFRMTLRHARQDTTRKIHGSCEAVITMGQNISNSPESYDDCLQFSSRNNPFEVKFGAMLLGEVASQPNKDHSNWLSTTSRDTCRRFCGPHDRKRDPSESRAIPEPCDVQIAIDRALESTTGPPTAHCSMRVRAASASAYLAIQASHVVASLQPEPVSLKRLNTIKPTKMTRKRLKKGGILTVSCRETVFHVKIARLREVSPVFDTCFANGHFMEAAKQRYDMSAFSQDAVEEFLIFCSFDLAPNCGQFAVELAELAHQYEVYELVRLCEIHLIHELMYCSHIGRLGEIAAVALKLDLQLLLAAFDVLLHDHLRTWLLTWTVAQKNAWFDVLDGLAGFERRRLTAVAELRQLQLADDFQVTVDGEGSQVVTGPTNDFFFYP